MSLSVVINTKNAAPTLERTLRSVAFADEIVIVDMESTDETLKIAKKYTKNIFEHQDVGYVEPARNFAIKKSKSDWILIVDADEVVTDSLQKVIKSIVKVADRSELDVDCFYLPRKNLIFDKWVRRTGWWPDYVLRLFRKGMAEWSEKIHSVPITRGIVKELPADEKYALVHYNYSSVSEFISRLNRYSSIQAKQFSHRKSSAISPSALIETFSDEFLSRMFAYRGVDESMHGVGLSFLQGFSEISAMLKAWEDQQYRSKKVSNIEVIEALTAFQHDMHYWICDWQVNNNTGLKKLWWRIRRKTRI